MCLRGVELSGHAGYAEERTRISSAQPYPHWSLNIANSVEAFTEDGFEGEADEQTGGFSVSFHRRDQSGIEAPYEFSCSGTSEY